MNEQARGIVLFGEVVGSRRDPAAASAWLRRLCGELDESYAAERLAAFGFTQGDELQGLLAQGADPLRAVLMAGLHDDRWTMRWVIAAGLVEPGSGPATERTGSAFLLARDALAERSRRRDGLVMVTGDPSADRLLDDLAPLLAEMLGALSPRQRLVARLMLVDDLRQAEVADHLGISRATVSVTAARAHVRSIGRLVRAIRTLFAGANS